MNIQQFPPLRSNSSLWGPTQLSRPALTLPWGWTMSYSPTTKSYLPTQHCYTSNLAVSAWPSGEQHPNHHTKTLGMHTHERTEQDNLRRKISRNWKWEKWTLGYEQSMHQMNSRCFPIVQKTPEQRQVNCEELLLQDTAGQSWHQGARTPVAFTVTTAPFLESSYSFDLGWWKITRSYIALDGLELQILPPSSKC